MEDKLQKLSWGFQLSLNKKGSPIAKRVFQTVSEMDEYLGDVYDSAIAGIIVTVVGDTPENNGAYLINSVPHLENPELQVERTKLATGATETIKLSIAEDSQDLAYIEDNKLHITDMRSRWETSF
jgi:hypothetical protein